MSESLTIEDIRAKSCSWYEQLDDRKHENDIMRNDKTIYAGSPNEYKGSWNKCGKYGHKWTEYSEVTGSGFVYWPCGRQVTQKDSEMNGKQCISKRWLKCHLKNAETMSQLTSWTFRPVGEYGNPLKRMEYSQDYTFRCNSPLCR